ncbi:hypothetical protein EON66_05900 [archaeon]|nr:MAG: hypothetical protein EON66_05900 [archaeon]
MSSTGVHCTPALLCVTLLSAAAATTRLAAVHFACAGEQPLSPLSASLDCLSGRLVAWQPAFWSAEEQSWL